MVPTASSTSLVNQMPALRWMLADQEMSLIPMKAGPLHWLPLPWALGQVSPRHKPFKSCFRCSNCAGPGYMLHWFSKLDVLGIPSSGAGCKSWGSDVGFKLFSPQGEVHALVTSLLTEAHCPGARFYGKIVSILLPALMRASVVHPTRRIRLFFVLFQSNLFHSLLQIQCVCGKR